MIENNSQNSTPHIYRNYVRICVCVYTHACVYLKDSVSLSFQCGGNGARYEVLVDTDVSRTKFQRRRRRLSVQSGSSPQPANIILDDVVDDSALALPQAAPSE